MTVSFAICFGMGQEEVTSVMAWFHEFVNEKGSPPQELKKP